MQDKEFEYCLRCHRKLRKPEARLIGYGKICYEKMKSDKPKKALFHVKREE